MSEIKDAAPNYRNYLDSTGHINYKIYDKVLKQTADDFRENGYLVREFNIRFPRCASHIWYMDKDKTSQEEFDKKCEIMEREIRDDLFSY